MQRMTAEQSNKLMQRMTARKQATKYLKSSWMVAARQARQA
jgi:hypothetical protein